MLCLAFYLLLANPPQFSSPSDFTMSDPLVWMCIKDGNCFMRKKGNTAKRGGVMMFSAEPTNLMSINSFKNSGIANSKAIGFTMEEGETAGKKDVKIAMILKVNYDISPLMASSTITHFTPFWLLYCICVPIFRPQRTATSHPKGSPKFLCDLSHTRVPRNVLPARSILLPSSFHFPWLFLLNPC